MLLPTHKVNRPEIMNESSEFDHTAMVCVAFQAGAGGCWGRTALSLKTDLTTAIFAPLRGASPWQSRVCARQ